MMFRDYFKEEGWDYYTSWPGIWPTLIVAFVTFPIFDFVLDSDSRVPVVMAACSIAPTVTGITLAIAVTAVAFQLATFTVDDLRNFVTRDQAMKHFTIMRTATRLAIVVLIASFAFAIAISILARIPGATSPAWRWFFMASITIIALAISHAGFAVRAAFNFADLKVVLAEAIEQSHQAINEIDEKDRSDSAQPGAPLATQQYDDTDKPLR